MKVKEGVSRRLIAFPFNQSAPKPLSNMSKFLAKQNRKKKRKKKLKLKLPGNRRKITAQQKAQYHKYLNSAQWKEKRKFALEFYGNRCALCGNRYDLEIHHRTYKNIFKEPMEDLMILCETCHKHHHKGQIWKNGKESKYMRNPKYEVETVTYYPKR
jgi:5-methylcytosine-specific restriction endonuclease McrA